MTTSNSMTTDMDSSVIDSITKAFKQIQEFTSNQPAQDFELPPHYFKLLKDMTTSNSMTTDMDSSVIDSITKAFKQIQEFTSNQPAKDFELPPHYVKSGTDSFTQNVNTEYYTEDIDKVRRTVESVAQEVRYQCVIIKDFELPATFFTEFYHEPTENKPSPIIPKKIKRRRSITGRSSKEKDRDRKRQERTTISSKYSSETLTNVDDSESRWQKKYRENANYRGTKKQYNKKKYYSDVSYQSAKKDYSKQSSKHKYTTDSHVKEIKKAASKLKYDTNPKFQLQVKAASKQKYDTNPKFQLQVKAASKQKYDTNPKFQLQVKAASKQKYDTNPKFQLQVKAASKQKYDTNPKFQLQVKAASKQKYETNPKFQLQVKAANKMRYQNNPKFRLQVTAANKLRYLRFRSQVKQARCKRYASDSEFRDKIKKLNRLRYRQNILVREKYKRRLQQQYQRELLVRQRKIDLVQQRRLKQKADRKNLSGIAEWFRGEVRNGPKYICSVCLKFKFRKQVIPCDKDKYTSKGQKSESMANQCISHQFFKPCTAECMNNCDIINHKLWICYTCHRHLIKGTMPADANANGLQLPPVHESLRSLNKLEKQLVSLRIPFMKLVQLPKGNQRGIVGPCVSIPSDIQKTTTILPRTDNQVIRCKLKRKLTYKGHSQYEFVSTKKMCQALQYLKASNPYYQDVSVNQDWNDEDLNEQDEEVADQRDDDHNDAREDGDIDQRDDEHNDDKQEEDDPSLRVRGFPSETCLQPVDIGQEILDQHFDNIFCVAPGEGSTPVSMMQEIGNEAMSFPAQFPEGSFGSYDSTRTVRLTRSRYLHARLLSGDDRFSSDPSYIFYAQYLSELEQVISKVSIALRKSTGKDAGGSVITANMLTDRNQLKSILTSDQGYKFLTPIRGTPPYWQAALRDLMATIRQLGIPNWFATFSAADMRWSEILKVMMEQKQDARCVDDLDWTAKSEILRNNPVMNAVMFDHRFHTFLKEIIIKRGVIGKVKDRFYRIEFQQRGSPHAHCLFWIDNAPLLDKDDDQAVCDFLERYVTCKLPDKNDDPELHELVSSVQQHSKGHSKSCKKKGTTCRFNFPRPPSERTFISRPQSLMDPSTPESPQAMKANAQNVLLRLWNVINGCNIQVITTKNLFATAGINQEQFEKASNIVTKRTNITFKRDPADIWINQYNPDLLRCWNANMDLQYITDPYSCVMYIISYISKTEREMGVVLENARKEAAEGNCDAQEAMKKIGSAYFRQREVSAQEAAYRVCGLHLKESSRKVQFIPCGENQVRLSLPLNVIKMKGEQLDDQDLWMVSLYDRYKSRPVGEEFESICYASFCSDYYSLSPSQVPKNPVKSANLYKLQNDLGYIKKRSRTDSAVVRYPRFSSKKKPLLYFQASLQLFLPHRTENQLKPDQFETFEEMYLNGAVVLPPTTQPQSVKSIVERNRQKFEQNADALDEAQEMIDIQGPLEDAWALIAPQSEAERLESLEEREIITEEDSIEIPELDNSNRRTRQGADIEIRQTLFSTSEMQKCMRQLNEEQKAVFYRVRQWCLDKFNGKDPEPLQIFVSGGAGTGKSHLIKCLYFESNRILSPCAPNPDDIIVLLTAPTATAAFNIGGTTLHQAFSLTKSLPLPYMYKRDDELNKLRCKLQNLKILIIDEISMVGQRVLVYVSERLRQIKQSGNAIFGNICVIAVGDFYQLPPVKQKCLYDLRPQNFFPLWTINFSLVELNQIMRQKDDSAFAQLLNRLRVKKKEESVLPADLAMLGKCVHHTAPPETLHIFGTNKEVDSHNSDMIEKVCEVTETIEAQDYDKDAQSGKLTLKDTPYDTSHDYLPSKLTIGPKARVMLIRNLDVSCGLVNGALGTVSKILPKKTGSSLPDGVLVLFDNKKIIDPEHSSRRKEHLPVKITTVEENLQNNATRHQFPLKLAWACTTHKVQGITVDKAVVSMKHIFSAGMAYVALSRVTSMDGLVIKDFKQDKIYCNEQIANSLQQMPRLLLPNGDVHDSYHQDMTIILHNIQGINPHLEDLRANTAIARADFICLTETWLDKKSSIPSVEGFSFVQKTRFLSYSVKNDLFKDLKHKKHGGVGIFVEKHKHYHQLTFDSLNMECVALHLDDINTSLVLIYKPEAFTTSVFLEELQQALLTIPQDCNTIMFGDFNQDILKNNSSIQRCMEQHGYKQIVDKPTTDGGTLIDHVYMKGNLDFSLHIKQTYYSYHNLLSLKIKLPNH